jgi:hypothetical protein
MKRFSKAKRTYNREERQTFNRHTRREGKAMTKKPLRIKTLSTIPWKHPTDPNGHLTLEYDSDNYVGIHCIEGEDISPSEEAAFWEKEYENIAAAIAEKEMAEAEAARESYEDEKFLRSRGE